MKLQFDALVHGNFPEDGNPYKYDTRLCLVTVEVDDRSRKMRLVDWEEKEDPDAKP